MGIVFMPSEFVFFPPGRRSDVVQHRGDSWKIFFESQTRFHVLEGLTVKEEVVVERESGRLEMKYHVRDFLFYIQCATSAVR